MSLGSFVAGVLFGSVISVGVYFLDITFDADYQKGFKDGERHALNTRNVSPELEKACLALWVTDQTRKWYELNK